ncbi:zinc ribbon domain-containing protein [Capnocytophaga canis]|uniref:zinc ribbon domain-containing protein n=1 Tax=Capnocytophaga canis TaxID=1848903 RepID=UPI0015626151|nr:C4-type zinc ribbon domain-containing protein [Capnocytophaga canis]
MTKKAEITVEEKLRMLYDLQLIDSQIDELQNVRGQLPLEVSDLEDEVEGLKSRLVKFKEELEQLQSGITQKKNVIEEAKILIKKYVAQQKNVRNNREYNSITKEIEYQELEIQLAEKRIKEFKAQVDLKKESIRQIENKKSERETHLKHKKEELNSILAETEKEEAILREKAVEFAEQIEERLLKAYQRIRGSVVNRLAVVPVERGASGGSFFTIPPQVQVEIATRKKIITDEHSGRILVDAALAEEEKEKMNALFESIKQ